MLHPLAVTGREPDERMTRLGAVLTKWSALLKFEMDFGRFQLCRRSDPVCLEHPKHSPSADLSLD